MSEITWVKLKTDMFENDKIKLIEALPAADTIIVIWVKLLAAAGKANQNGFIMLTENIPMNTEEMATIFNRDINTVRLALQTFQRYGMIELDGDAVRIKNWGIHQNIDGMDRVRLQNRERKRRQREKEKLIKLGPVPSRDCHATDIDKELDIDKEKER
ncbi:phage replisome organizer N-terminal domain-containing protein, partial [Kurthia sp. Dielmo]|uniref:phage replisome organizer N-terminal domain-containing protein n=1 Tax=Kurthia sp. Dielmo TaxID=1033738 RepID=UPI0005CB8D3C